MTNPHLPPVLYLPTAPIAADGTGETTVELRRTGDGRIALLAYTALDRLVECCGEHQPWLMVHTEHLPKLHERQPYDVILLDGEIPEELRRTAATRA
ncbi:SAV_915 family protein [Prauserella endophytica]|uniref:SseB protein N-terminal domain-containing protein n=1 Tax=Prauserella endophytica TaxID=1592324 RepID=A0ABY2RYT0_9PSEU|nr:SAV_915 family protein [Prauserella endophytica]PXY19796.1 hypothetical protein BAY59_32505 [Prauserella coralliicola]TKG64248.1 hypothetical protein FCN18_28970 [Prauserella endophytica]